MKLADVLCFFIALNLKCLSGKMLNVLNGGVFT